MAEHTDAGGGTPRAPARPPPGRFGRRPTAEAVLAPVSAPGPAPPPAPDPLAARPWLSSYPPAVPSSYDYPLVPLTRLLDDAAKDFPDVAATAYLAAATSYRRLVDETDRLATALAQLGVQRGDRVGIALPNCPQHVAAVFATGRLGAVAVECGTGRDADELGHVLDDAGCAVLVLADPVYRVLGELKGRLRSLRHVVGTALDDPLTSARRRLHRLRHRSDPGLWYRIPSGEGVLRYVELVRRSPPSPAQVDIDPASDLAALVPDADGRLAGLTHLNLVAAAFQVRLWVPDVLAGHEEVVCATPFSSPVGLAAGLGFGVLCGATLALVPEPDPAAVLAALAGRIPTLFPGEPELFAALAEVSADKALATVRASLSIGAPSAAGRPLGDEVVAAFERLTGGELRQGYGCGGAAPFTHANPVYGPAKAGSIGLPVCDTVCSLRHPADPARPAPGGEAGELAVRGPQVMDGYWRRPDATAQVMRDGWLLTGDLAEIDDEGYVTVVGRVPRD